MKGVGSDRLACQRSQAAAPFTSPANYPAVVERAIRQRRIWLRLRLGERRYVSDWDVRIWPCQMSCPVTVFNVQPFVSANSCIAR